LYITTSSLHSASDETHALPEVMATVICDDECKMENVFVAPFSKFRTIIL
jgi:hypothetical protein